jgi:iron complex outermembrane recepter protein
VTQTKIKQIATKSKAILLLASASWIATASAQTASAQTASAQTAPSTPVAEASSGLEEIIVTAQKRNESLQDVPISVVAFGGEKLTKLGVTNTNDLPLAVPGFQIAGSAQNNLYFIRGIGSQQVGTGTFAAVSTFVDGVYAPFTSAALKGLSNISSIEVIKGPQGTLFGRNSTGGVVQINTKNPTQELSGDFSATYGNYNHYAVTGYISGPLGKNVAADISFIADDQQDGYGKNITTGADVFKRRLFAVRSKVVIDASERTTIRLIGEYSSLKSDFGAIISIPTGLNELFNLVTGGPLLIPGDYNVAGDTPNGYKVDSWGGSLKIATDFEWSEFSSITSYTGYKGHTDVDFDGTPQTFAPTATDAREHVITQEVQLSSPKESKLTWTVGAFFLSQKGFTDPFTFSSPISTIVFGAPPGTDYLLFAESGTTSIAGYAQATATIFPDTRLTLGARYTQDRRTIEGFATAGGVIRPSTVGNDSAKFGKPTFRVALDHDFSRDFKVYASWNRGFQSGTYNSNSAAGYNPLVNRVLKPENIDAYEIGFKSELFDRQVRFNMAAFLYDYTNLQQQTYDNNVLVSLNAGAARTKGVDVELLYQPSGDFSMGVSAAYLDARYTEYLNAPGFFTVRTPAGGLAYVAQPIANAKGKRLAFSPEWTATAFVSHTLETSVGKFDTNASVSTNSGYFAEPSNGYKEPSFYVINLRETWSPNDKVSISLFVKNLNNRKYYQGLITALPTGVTGNTPGAPREYGITARYQF